MKVIEALNYFSPLTWSLSARGEYQTEASGRGYSLKLEADNTWCLSNEGNRIFSGPLDNNISVVNSIEYDSYIQFNRSLVNEGIEPLNFELMGLVSIKHALASMNVKEVAAFFSKGGGHPKFIGRPSITQKLYEQSSDKTDPFLIFVATQRVNPQSNRPLMSEEDVADYRNTHKMVIFNKSWRSTIDIARSHLFRGANDDNASIGLSC